MARNCISSLQSHGKALEKECCLPGVFRDSGDMPANLLCELNGHLMPCTSCFYGKWVEDVCAGQFVVFVYLVLRCLLGCCTWFSCCAANVGLSVCICCIIIISKILADNSLHLMCTAQVVLHWTVDLSYHDIVTVSETLCQLTPCWCQFLTVNTPADRQTDRQTHSK